MLKIWIWDLEFYLKLELCHLDFKLVCAIKI